MYNPKTEIYTALNSLGYTCKQGSQAVFNSVPAITFTIGNNIPNYDLEKSIVKSEIQVVVDVWANDSVTASTVVGLVEAKMRTLEYLLTYSADVPFPEGSLFHTQMRFSGLK